MGGASRIRPHPPFSRGPGRSPRLAPLPSALVPEGGAGLAPLWRGGERRAGAAPRPRRQRACLLVAAAAPGGPRSRDAAGVRHWRAAQRLRGHVCWPRPPATMSLTARVSCSMLSCFVSVGLVCGGPGVPVLAALAAPPSASPCDSEFWLIPLPVAPGSGGGVPFLSWTCFHLRGPGIMESACVNV